MAVARLIAGVLAAATVSCGGMSTPPPAPTPVDPNAPVSGAHTGAVAIELAGATPSPGATITGCGAAIAGCAGRLQMSFRLRAGSTGGTVLFTSATLHGANRAACLSARGSGFALAANAVTTIELVFDGFDPACAVPFEATDLAVTLEGTTEVASRQEFGIRYRFAA